MPFVKHAAWVLEWLVIAVLPHCPSGLREAGKSEDGFAIGNDAAVPGPILPVRPLQLASAICDTIWLHKKDAYYAVRSVLYTRDISRYILEMDDFENKAKVAVADTQSLISQLARGTFNTSSAFQSDFWKLHALKANLRAIEEGCGQPLGFVDNILNRKGYPPPEVTTGIKANVAAMENVIDSLSDSIFCHHFNTWLERHIINATKILIDWEARTGARWFPRRQIANRELALTDAEVGSTWGLTNDQMHGARERAKRASIGSRATGPNFWLHGYTTFPDRLMDDPEESQEVKDNFHAAITGMRMVFGEMSRMSKQCRERADVHFAHEPICRRCPWCCRMPSNFPDVFAWLQAQLAAILENDDLMNLNAYFSDALAVASISVPTSIMYLASRVVKAVGDRNDICTTALGFLDNFSLPQHVLEAEQQLLSLMNYEGPRLAGPTMEVHLPELGDNACAQTVNAC
eukprot:TRINITY_DN77576_c0_g1_i1.p1 TRINITY_DN77576_c0_g1~~TRINITY_DN77576_c0_g1_i1.p1  ORF type:complete len:461 (+),score=59.02 TRINITY_DN77576_c0_g1_i1:32-1414(+)